MKRSLFKSALVLGGLLVGLAVSELVVRLTGPIVNESGSSRVSINCHEGLVWYPHPYFSHVRRPRDWCLDGVGPNTEGFFGARIPRTYDSKFFTVLVTGGSVAEEVAYPYPENQFSLERFLNEAYVPPDGRERFRVINGAVAGNRQPAQSIVAFRALPLVDAVLSIEGFNEHYLVMSGESLWAPTIQFYAYLYSLEKSPVWYFLTRTLVSFNENLKASPVRHSQFVSLVVSVLTDVLVKRYETGMSAIDTPNPMGILSPQPDELNGESHSTRVLDEYKSIVRQIHHAASSAGKKFLTVLQPTPALYKSLTEEEKSMVDRYSSSYVYLKVVEDLLALGDEGLAVYSSLRVFENEQGTIYRDSIHFDRAPSESNRTSGLEIFVEDLGRAIEKKWGWERKHKVSGK
ncbi:MAG: hypothetical protein H6624_12470 [Bdellovibrionaceae bacterium]|nr:hypothetical protein [Bdellovibrionales bacterium]MCB9085158.1 hypothetical protein [Pseudobdellovibrionaceae bacterium]